jgi:hypothetical protein
LNGKDTINISFTFPILIREKGFQNSFPKTRNILIAKIERFTILRVYANLEGKSNLEFF